MSSVNFFFFKLKTAYEMRISDWSSDVCSSDLPVERRIGRIVGELRPRRAGQPHDMTLHERREPAIGGDIEFRLPGAEHVGRAEIEIGRASCRGRVCKYG